MARMIPASPPDFHGSLGEESVFRALRTLPDDVVVIHSFRWIHPGNARLLTRDISAQGEGDFVLFDPRRGVLVVEVKGGEVWCENGEWFQRNRKTGAVATIAPEAQASNTMHRIRAEVVAKMRDAAGVLFGYAVWFPDYPVERSRLPMNYHADTTLDRDDIARPAAAIERAFEYWAARFPSRRATRDDAAKRIIGVLAPTLSIVPSMRHVTDDREDQFVRLTREQARITEFLDEQPHAAILGAAGTGKTLLALEKARRLASPTAPVLFLCFNAALREHLETHHPQANVRYLTFHGLAREVCGRDGSLEDAEAALLEHLADDRDIPYTHVLIDEAQDFDRTWLEFLRHRFRDGAFYVFYDRYQAVQGEKDTRWLDEMPCRLVLTRNCRNTDAIARTAYRAAGLTISPTLGIDGPAPVLHAAIDEAAAVQIVDRLVEASCNRHRTPPHELAVLSLERIDGPGAWSAGRLGGQRTSENPRKGQVTLTTARRFKGLEAALVIIVDVDFRHAASDEWRRRLYVACSRARHAVHIVTTTPESALGQVLPIFAGTEKVRPSWRTLARLLSVRLGGGKVDPFNEQEVG